MAEEGFENVTLLPDDGAQLTGDEMLEGTGTPVGDIPSGEDYRPLGRGWAFDFESGAFIRHGRAPMVVHGINNLRYWVEKTLRTARNAYPIYTSDYGIDEPYDLIGRQFTADLVGQYARRVQEALSVHDRITEVKDFKFSRADGGDSEILFVSFTVAVDQGTEIPFHAIPLGGS